ncbi:hypothetical protein LZ016_13255 [Sphingomonas sp. SM33]|uniref:Uncharacterized protein n=1 Tax=Sphingomonas telluris TaxID=2907998 RepID=A0ABS9VQ34_9SPHN|nr:hypothetical protein [Sphingomonas telluris]MCH8617062.1 hypothetical protein [Sphingomonas telluris]
MRVARPLVVAKYLHMSAFDPRNRAEEGPVGVHHVHSFANPHEQFAGGALAVKTALCDAEAPGRLNPFELRAWARERRPTVEIALVGNIETAANKAAELCDEGPQLARPYDPQSVVAYIRRALGGRGRQTSSGPLTDLRRSPE